MFRTLLQWLVVAIVLAALMAGLLYVFQRQLLYLPTRYSQQTLRFEVERRFDGKARLLEPFDAIVVEPPPGRPIVGTAVLFHGNAGSAVDRAVLAPPFTQRALRLVLAEYPGYGARDGLPSQDAIVADARLLLAEVHRRHPDVPLLLIGESLGTGVAAQLAAVPGSMPPPSRVVLLTPFLSVVETAARTFPLLPVRLLVRDRFDSATALRGYGGPLALLIAGRDEVLGPDQGRTLALQARERRNDVTVVELPQSGHNDWIVDVSDEQWDVLLGHAR